MALKTADEKIAMDVKQKINPVTGCAHIENFYGYKLFRVCSACNEPIPENIEEERLNYCWYCGATFDHTDDEPEDNCAWRRIVCVEGELNPKTIKNE